MDGKQTWSLAQVSLPFGWASRVEGYILMIVICRGSKKTKNNKKIIK